MARGDSCDFRGGARPSRPITWKRIQLKEGARRRKVEHCGRAAAMSHPQCPTPIRTVVAAVRRAAAATGATRPDERSESAALPEAGARLRVDPDALRAPARRHSAHAKGDTNPPGPRRSSHGPALHGRTGPAAARAQHATDSEVARCRGLAAAAGGCAASHCAVLGALHRATLC